MANDVTVYRDDTIILNFSLQDINPCNTNIKTPHPMPNGATYDVNLPGASSTVVLSTNNTNEINITDAPNGKFTATCSPAKSALLNLGTKQAIDVIETLAISVTGDTHSSTTIDGLSSIAGILPGATITGSGIPASTTVAAILSSTSIQLSQAALATASGVTLTLSGQVTTFEKVKIINILDRANP